MTLVMWMGEGGEEGKGVMEGVGVKGNLAPHQHEGSMLFHPQMHRGSGQGRLGFGYILKIYRDIIYASFCINGKEERRTVCKFGRLVQEH